MDLTRTLGKEDAPHVFHSRFVARETHLKIPSCRQTDTREKNTQVSCTTETLGGKSTSGSFKRDLKRNSPLSVVAVAWGRSVKGWTLHFRPLDIRWSSTEVTESWQRWSMSGHPSWAFQKLDKKMIKISVKMTRQEQKGVKTIKNRHRHICTHGRVTYPEARITVPFSAITSTGGEFALKFKRLKLSNSILNLPQSQEEKVLVFADLRTCGDNDIPPGCQTSWKRGGLNLFDFCDMRHSCLNCSGIFKIPKGKTDILVQLVNPGRMGCRPESYAWRMDSIFFIRGKDIYLPGTVLRASTIGLRKLGSLG